MSGSNAWNKPSGGEGYMASLTDLFVGLLFLFIILLMYFATQLRTTVDDLVDAEASRNKVLTELAVYMNDRGIETELDYAAGVLRFPDLELFEKGNATPRSEGEVALGHLADAFATYLPCYTWHPAEVPPEACRPEPHIIDAVFIEGHTDSDVITRGNDNWNLSSQRAAMTWRFLSNARPTLRMLFNGPPGTEGAQLVFSVAGYADQRPIMSGDSDEAKARNRRIDIRIVMHSPGAVQAHFGSD